MYFIKRKCLRLLYTVVKYDRHRVMFYFTEITFEEQIRVIELKELSAEDKRQIYTELVCISLERDSDF